MGYVYCLHFNTRFGHAGHYIGYAETCAEERIEEHRRGQGSRLVAAAIAAGITFDVAFIKPGTRADERRYKNRGGARRICPICQAKHLPPAPRCVRKPELNPYRQRKYGCRTWDEFLEQCEEAAAETGRIFGPA